MIDFKKIKPVLNKNTKDPVRYPKVILGYEGKSKRDFNVYLQAETKMLIKEMNNDIH